MKKTGNAMAQNLLWSVVGAVLLLFITVGTAFAAPRIVSVTPANLSQLDQVTEVTATVYDAVSISKFVVDGSQVTGSISGNVLRLTRNFGPGLHKIYFSVVDSSGNSAEKTWEFYVNDSSNKYMLPNQNSCVKCHPTTWKNFPGHLVDLRLGGHPHSCGSCHYYSYQNDLILRADGSTMAGSCMNCHSTHSNGLYLDPVHELTDWKGTWPESGVTIKAPRNSFDCQYCHQPGTKARTGHDLVSDHKVDEPQCESCHSGILTIVHNAGSTSCNTCHESTDPVVQNTARGPMEAKAGTHYTAINIGTGKGVESYTYQDYNDLNLSLVSLVVYGPNNQAVSPEWSPGPGYEIKRVKVDEWKLADRQYVMAYVEKEDKWYTLPVADEGKALYRRYPIDSPAREIYLPRGTTKIKTRVVSGPAGSETYSTGIAVKAVYYGKNAKCTDCHAQTVHESSHTYTFDQRCLSCHRSSLTEEHMNNPKTQTRSLSCDTCHKNVNPSVTMAVNNKNRQCSGCHSRAHNTNIVDNVPTDIPLYSGFKWTAPIGSQTWKGEGWGPEEMINNGKVLISDLRADVSSQAIEDFYNAEMTANGWTPGTRIEGTGYMQLEYVKDTRAAYIYWYNGSIPNTGNSGTTKYRLLILYN